MYGAHGSARDNRRTMGRFDQHGGLSQEGTDRYRLGARGKLRPADTGRIAGNDENRRFGESIFLNDHRAGVVGDALGVARDGGELQRAQAAKQRQHRQMSCEEIQWRPFVLFAQLDAELVTCKSTAPPAR